MSNAPRSARSFKKIELSDLSHLALLAKGRVEQAFRRRPQMRRLYEDRLIAICLCQGAADHYVHPRSRSSRGVQDFDVWAFYAAAGGLSFWNRKRSPADFGPSKFGHSPLDSKRYIGRRVDVFWRSISAAPGSDVFDAVRIYLTKGETPSARALSEKAVVAIWPGRRVGEVLWDPKDR